MVFTTNYRIGNLFRFKDKLPSSLRSKIVYFFKYSRCNSTYVGLQNDTEIKECIIIKTLKPTLIDNTTSKELSSFD